MEKEKERPDGLLIVVGLFGLSTAGNIFFCFYKPSFAFLHAIFGLMSLYICIGLYRGWRASRILALIIVFASLILTILNWVLAPEILSAMPPSEQSVFIIANMARPVVLLLMAWCLLTNEVKQFFHNKKRVGDLPAE